MNTAQPNQMPVLFVGHGNPMNAIEHNEFYRRWQEIGQALPRPKAILCISAHWETQGIYVTASEQPETIHDFYGFPRALFDVQYPAPGDPGLARRVKALIQSEDVQLDADRGLDHGVWSVLVAMHPEADIPVVQLSIDTRQPGNFHYGLAQQLQPLRDEGVLIIGSGNMVHNLRMFKFHDSTPVDWAVRCDEELKQMIQARDNDGLMRYETRHADAKLAVPTPEHYYPLLYALALQNEHDAISFFNDKVVSSISMTSIFIGDTSATR